MKFKQFTSTQRSIRDFSVLTEQQKIDEAAKLCSLSPQGFVKVIESLTDQQIQSIDSYIPNPLYLVEDSVFNRTNLTIPRRKQKYTPIFIDLLNKTDGVMRIHPMFVHKYGMENFPIKSISNKSQLLDFLHKADVGPAASWPEIKTKDGPSVKIYHLAKTGQFRTVKTAETDTNIKEGLVSVMFNCLKKKHLTTSAKFTKDTLVKMLVKVGKGIDSSLGESAKATSVIAGWLALQGKNPTKSSAELLQQVFSQAVAIYNEYPKAKLDRDTIFNSVRELGAAITMFPKDKWNPGDLYVVLPGALTKLAQAQKDIAADTNPANKLQLLNNLFVHEWGATNGAFVSISLKLARAQGGKAKDFLRKYSTETNHYNTTQEEQSMPIEKCVEAVMYMRKWLKNTCNKFAGDVDIVYNGTVNVTDTLANNEKRLREKYACLKLVNFMLERGGVQNIDDTIVSAIGFGLSLSGVNPTFFKIQASKDSGNVTPQKFSAGGAVTLFPVGEDTAARIYIDDNETSNNVAIRCKIEKGENVCDVLMMARSLGYTQVTLEITKIKCTTQT